MPAVALLGALVLMVVTVLGATSCQEEETQRGMETATEQQALAGENVVEAEWGTARGATVAITRKADDGRRTTCSGIAVSPYHILTAAHCVPDGEDIYVDNLTNIGFGLVHRPSWNRHLCDDDVQCRNMEGPASTEYGCDCENEVWPPDDPESGVFVHAQYSGDGDHAKDVALLRLRYGLHHYPDVGYYDIFKSSYNEEYDGPYDWASGVKHSFATIYGFGTSNCSSGDSEPGDHTGVLLMGWQFRVENVGSGSGTRMFKLRGSDTWVCGGDSGGPIFDDNGRLIGLTVGKELYWPWKVRGVELMGHGSGGSHWGWIKDQILADNAVFDSDGDGFYDYDDNCPGVFNQFQFDFDGDGLGDACDPCSPRWGSSESMDNHWTICDEKPDHANCDHRQHPNDKDEQGNFLDDDNDGIVNACDNCRWVPNLDQADTNGNSLTTHGADFWTTGDRCDPIPSLAIEGVKVATYGGCHTKPLPMVEIDFATVGGINDPMWNSRHVQKRFCDCHDLDLSVCSLIQCKGGEAQLGWDRVGWYPLSWEGPEFVPPTDPDEFSKVEIGPEGFAFLQQSRTCLSDEQFMPSWPWPVAHFDGPVSSWTDLWGQLCPARRYSFQPAVRQETGAGWRWKQELWWKSRKAANVQQEVVPRKQGYLWLRADPDYYPDEPVQSVVPFDVPLPQLDLACIAQPWVMPGPLYNAPWSGVIDPVDITINPHVNINTRLVAVGRFDDEALQGKFATPPLMMPADSAVSSLRVALLERGSGRIAAQAHAVWPRGVALGEAGFAAGGLVMVPGAYERLMDQQVVVFGDLLAEQVEEIIVPPDEEPGLVPVIALFGGENAAAALSDTLWLGKALPVDEDGEYSFSWEPAPSTGENRPCARKDALLLFDREGNRLLLFGGETHDAVLGDLWAYDLRQGLWTEIEARGDAPETLAGAAVAAGRVAVAIYGGRNAAGVAGELYTFDPASGTFGLLSDGAGPGARLGSALAFTYQGRELFLYGGRPDGGEPTNDLWRFDLGTRTFEQVAAGGDWEGLPRATDRPLLIAEQRLSGGLLAYTGELTRADMYWKHDGDGWLTQLESEPMGDWDGDGIPNVVDPDPLDYTFFFDDFSTHARPGDGWNEMKQALEDAGWHEETPCGGSLFGLDRWPPPSTDWLERARLDGSAHLRKTACNPSTVTGPEVDVSALASLPEHAGTLRFELTYRRSMAHPVHALEVGVVLVEDGQPRTVAVIANGQDQDWQTLSVESMAQHSVRVVLVNRIVLPARSLLVNDARFTMRREE